MVTLSSPPAFGFETENVNAMSFYKKNQPEQSCIERISQVNRSKGLAYIPLVGTILGGIRVHHACTNSTANFPNRANHIVRGVMEVCCLGILLALIDLVVTAYRECRARCLKA